MSRTLPSECAHGYIYDWGDFGCDEDCTSTDGRHSQPERCPEGCNDAFLSPSPVSSLPTREDETDG